MRRSLARGAAVVAVVLAVSALGGATPAACEGTCEVAAVTAGYLMPVTEIAHGTRVVWTSLDTSHPTGEAAEAGRVSCFDVPVGPGVEPEPVKFKVRAGRVKATESPGTARAVTRRCTSATELLTGDFLVPYRCRIHPQMVAALMIDARG